MNDALAMYPHDKRLNFLFGYWLYKQDQYDLSEKLTLRALAEDPSYATAYNQMGYLYSRRGNYARALESAGKYVQLLPNEPNPHDSYGEMLRLSGRFEEALDQYRLALKIDPTFYISQKELGETYAIMGQGEKSREEYAKAVHDAPSDGLRAEYLQKSAMTYVRARQFDKADEAFLDAAEKAHAMQQWVWEARAYRIMAMYGLNQDAAAKNLEKAEALLAARTGAVAQADLDDELARIWRVRTERAAVARDFATAQTAVDKLQQMAQAGGIVSIERTYQGAAGTLLAAQGKYAAAIPHLEEDFANPLSIKILVAAYEKTKATEHARTLHKRIQDWKIPSIEEALVVPGLQTREAMRSKN
jgi:tetratricopeptide (TPR) repeat protein